MASTFTYATDPKRPERKNGRGVSFKRPDGKQRTLKLGAVSKATVRDLKSRVELLLKYRTTRSVPDPELLQWLADVPDDLHAKLVANGLADARVKPPRRQRSPIGAIDTSMSVATT